MPPTAADLHHLEALMRAGDREAAIVATRALIRRHPREALLHNILGVAQMQAGRADEAVRALSRALDLAPGYREANGNLIAALIAADRLPEAEAPIRTALAADPTDALMLRNLASLLHLRGQRDEARATLARALALEPGHPGARLTMAGFLREAGDLTGALALLDALIAEHPTDADPLVLRGEIRATEGALTQAEADFTAGLLLDPLRGTAWEGLATVHRFAADDPLIARMEALLADPATPAATGMHLGFALAKAFTDIGGHERVFPLLNAAQRVRRATVAPYDHSRRRKEVQRLKALFPASTVAALGARGDPSALPVFIVGLPRSGTSLVEQILASHPRVFGAGELPQIGALGAQIMAAPRLLDGRHVHDWAAAHLAMLQGLAPQAARVIDKMPANADWVGLILTLFPSARILRMQRDPRDVALSIYRTNFSDPKLGWTSDLSDLASFVALQEDLLDHWQRLFPQSILPVRYEDLVQQPESQTRRLAGFCALDWDDAMLAPHKTARVVVTASASQVRRAISTGSVQGWQRHAAELAPFTEALHRFGRAE